MCSYQSRVLPHHLLFLIDNKIIGETTNILHLGGRTFISPTIFRTILTTCVNLTELSLCQFEREPGG